jgi:hypothetical protein
MISPDTVLDTTDPGDDVASRFNYQHCYAAINAIRLISGESVVAVICENHEDIRPWDPFTRHRLTNFKFLGFKPPAAARLAAAV